ncbi:SDR family oxidoreductase [Jatrophihabitans fulvus]
MRLAVAGGTGTVGRMVVDQARAAGDTVAVLARSEGVDLRTGAGLDEALAGCDAVVDVSNIATLSRRRSEEFFAAATGNLVRASGTAGVAHLVVLSIVGVDEVGLGYYTGKRRQEQIARAGPVPATVLRATQFHEFAAQSLARALGPVVPVPRMRCRPVAAGEVAGHLVSLARGPALGQAPELAGPEEAEMTDLVRRLLRRRADRRLVVPVRLPGGAGRAMAGGGLLPRAGGPRGEVTFEQWLGSADARA